MRNPDPGFDFDRYRKLLAEAVDAPKRLALIDLLIEERAKDRLDAHLASNREAMTVATIAKVVGKGPDFAKSTASMDSSSTSTIDHDLDIFHIPPTGPIG